MNIGQERSQTCLNVTIEKPAYDPCYPFLFEFFKVKIKEVLTV